MNNNTKAIEEYLKYEGDCAWDKLVQSVPNAAKLAVKLYPPKFLPRPGGSEYVPDVAYINYSRAKTAMGKPKKTCMLDGVTFYQALRNDLYHESTHHLQYLTCWKLGQYTDAEEGVANLCTFKALSENDMNTCAEFFASRLLATADFRKIRGRSVVSLPFGLRRTNAAPMLNVILRYPRGFVTACRVFEAIGEDSLYGMFRLPFENFETVQHYLERFHTASKGSAEESFKG